MEVTYFWPRWMTGSYHPRQHAVVFGRRLSSFGENVWDASSPWSLVSLVKPVELQLVLALDFSCVPRSHTVPRRSHRCDSFLCHQTAALACLDQADPRPTEVTPS